MANTKISDFTSGAPAQSTDEFVIARTGANFKLAASDIKTLVVGAGSVSVASGKTLTANNTLTLAGTDATTMTFPSTSATLARTDAGNTFTGNQTFSSGSLILSGNLSSAAWTTNGIRLRGVPATLTDTTSSGTVAAAYTNVLGGNTIAASNATTFTDYFTSFINGPTAGTNVTFTRNWALGLGGSLQIASASELFFGTDLRVGRRAPANLRLGAADAASPQLQTLSVQSVVAGTSNTAGANFTITGSQGTGTGAGGSIIFQVALPGSSGIAQNALTNALSIVPLTSGGSNTFYVSSGTPSAGLLATAISAGFISSSINGQQFTAENTSAYSSVGGAFAGLYANTGLAITSGSRMGGFFFGAASSASTLRNSAIIHGFATQNWVDGSAYGSRIEIGTTANNSTTRTTRLIIGNSGIITFGATEANTVPALKPSSTTLQVRLGDDSAAATLEALSLKTGAPTGGTSGTWKLGVRVAATTTLDTTQYIEVDVGGTLYKLAVVTS